MKKERLAKICRISKNIPVINPLDKNECFVIRECAIYLERLLSRYSTMVNKESLSLLQWIFGPKIEELALYLLDQVEFGERKRFEEDLSECFIDPSEYPQTIIRILRNLPKREHFLFHGYILQFLRKKITGLKYRGTSEIEKNIESIQKMFGLSNEETKFCLFRFINTAWRRPKDFFEDVLKTSEFTGRQYLLQLLNVTARDLNDIRSGTLSKIGIINFDFSQEIEDEFLELFQNPSSKTISKNFFSQVPTNCLPLDYHMIDKAKTDYILSLLKNKPNSSTHILLYGKPGTGKTSYAHGLVKNLGLPAYDIIRGDEKNDVSKRRAAILACLNMTNTGNGSLIVIDEADNLLNTQMFWLFKDSGQDKGWLNQLLETPGARMIWITNNIENVDQSVLRRFAFSIFFKSFNRGQRVTLWNTVLRQHKVKSLYNLSEIENLSSHYKVNAGAIDMAVKKSIESGMKDFYKSVRLCLDSYQTLLNKGETVRDKEKVEQSYSLEGLNVQGDLHQMMNQLKKFDCYLRRPNTKNINMNLLFYGPPGTGKSCLARYIGHVLDREIICKRASDILDAYVGGTETNIKNAFQEAAAEDAVLLIDEADSLLFSRDKAFRAWEISLVNELLSQMENFKGILICTTNRLSELDEAAMRRFNYKIEMRYLTGEGNIIFYQKVLAGLVDATMDMASINFLKRIECLTPGDFKTVRDRFSFYEKGKVNNGMLIQALKEEDQMKQFHNGNRAVGF